MPHYFFHYRDENGLIQDPEGGDFPDLAKARAEAITTLRQSVGNVLRADRPAGYGQFEINDASGRLLAMVTIQDILGG